MNVRDVIGRIENLFGDGLDAEERRTLAELLGDVRNALYFEVEDEKQTETTLAPKDEGVPFVPGESYVPDYYRLSVPTDDEGGLRVQIDAVDVIAAAAEGAKDRHPFISFALKYLLRAGRKPGEPAIKDVYKAMEWLQRLLPKERPE